MHKEYIDLLEAILGNALSLAEASKILLEEHLKVRKKHVGHIAQFLIYSSCEECGKFLIVKDLYPQKLTPALLKKNGFYLHDRKWQRLLRIFAQQTGDFRRIALYNIPTIDVAKVLREKIREPALYVDFLNNQVVNSGFIKDKSFLLLTKITSNLIRYCNYELDKFKRIPSLR